MSASLNLLNSSRMAAYMRRSRKRFLVHTYTWTNVNGVVVPDEFDQYGDQIYNDSTPVSGKAALFLWEDLEVINEQGRILLRTPTLYVLYNDLIEEADLVTNVLQRDGTEIYGAGTVESIDTTAEAGDGVLKVLRLSGAVTI